jgi:hypothetical protein
LLFGEASDQQRQELARELRSRGRAGRRLHAAEGWRGQSVLQMFGQAVSESKLEAMLMREVSLPVDDNSNRYAPSYRANSAVTDDFTSTGVAEYQA